MDCIRYIIIRYYISISMTMVIHEGCTISELLLLTVFSKIPPADVDPMIEIDGDYDDRSFPIMWDY